MGKKGPLWWRESDWLLRGSSAANQILLRHSGPILSYPSLPLTPPPPFLPLLPRPGFPCRPHSVAPPPAPRFTPPPSPPLLPFPFYLLTHLLLLPFSLGLLLHLLIILYLLLFPQ